MFQLFQKTNFNDLQFMRLLSEHGFDCHHNGGLSQSDYAQGTITKFSNDQYQMVGQEQTFMTCSANIFYLTICETEKRFKYRLFG